jgi:hypothetical protein
MSAVYVYTDTGEALAGTASTKSETVPLAAIACRRPRVTWRQSVTRPMRIDLDFDVIVDGQTPIGHSHAGRLRRTTVTGTRRPEPTGCQLGLYGVMVRSARSAADERIGGRPSWLAENGWTGRRSGC